MSDEPVAEFVFASLAFLGVVCVIAGVWGRPNQTQPVCAKCKRDARPFAWDEPLRCACGAALDRPGSVRTKGRLRRPKVGVLGAVIVALACAGEWETVRLHQRQLTWVDHLPLFALRFGLAREQVWASESLARRLSKEQFSPAESGALLVYLHDEFKAKPVIRGELKETLRDLFQRWLTAGERNERVMAAASDVRVAPHLAAMVGAQAGSVIAIDIALSPVSDEDNWLVRVERITVDDVAVPAFQLSTKAVRGFLDSRVGRRVIVGDGVLGFPTTPETRPGKHRVAITLLLALTPAAQGAPLDELIDSELPPEQWRVDQRTVRVERFIEWESGP